MWNRLANFRIAVFFIGIAVLGICFLVSGLNSGDGRLVIVSIIFLGIAVSGWLTD